MSSPTATTSSSARTTDLGISYDLFTRTSTRNHYRVTQDLFRTLYEKGHLVEHTTLGAFSAATGRTLPDRYIEGTCPICGYAEARGDQCDNCGNQLDPVDLIEPRSIIDGSTPEFRETTHLFLDLPAFAEQLEQWLSAQEGWRPNVKNFSLGLVRELKPRAMTRDIDWGVPVPVDGYPEETKRIYVWFDAVIGYLSASVEWAHNRGTPDAWRDWWQNPAAGHFYFMGKDNIVFHSVIWPAMLLGYGAGGELGAGRGDLHLPSNVVASEYLTMEGKKASTSRNLAIWVADFLERYDADALRYYLTAGGPETQDTRLHLGRVRPAQQRRAARELGQPRQPDARERAPQLRRGARAAASSTERDRAVLDGVASGFAEVGALIEQTRFRAAVQAAMRWSSVTNQYLADEAPWTVVEDRPRPRRHGAQRRARRASTR